MAPRRPTPTNSSATFGPAVVAMAVQILLKIYDVSAQPNLLGLVEP